MDTPGIKIEVVDPVEAAESMRLTDRQLVRAYRNYQRYSGPMVDREPMHFVDFAEVFFQISPERTTAWLTRHGMPTPLPLPTETP